MSRPRLRRCRAAARLVRSWWLPSAGAKRCGCCPITNSACGGTGRGRGSTRTLSLRSRGGIRAGDDAPQRKESWVLCTQRVRAIGWLAPQGGCDGTAANLACCCATEAYCATRSGAALLAVPRASGVVGSGRVGCGRWLRAGSTGGGMDRRLQSVSKPPRTMRRTTSLSNPLAVRKRICRARLAWSWLASPKRRRHRLSARSNSVSLVWLTV